MFALDRIETYSHRKKNTVSTPLYFVFTIIDLEMAWAKIFLARTAAAPSSSSLTVTGPVSNPKIEAQSAGSLKFFCFTIPLTNFQVASSFVLCKITLLEHLFKN